MTNKKTALIVGATGLIGNHLLHSLLNSGSYKQVIILVRKSTGLQHSILKEHVVNFNDPFQYQLLVKADHVYCCLGTTIKQAGSKDAFTKVDLTYPLGIAEAAYKNGASVFSIITAMGANSKSIIFYNHVKGEVEKKISEIPFYNINILRPSLLLGKRKDKRKGEAIGKIIAQASSWLMVGPLKKYRAIQGETVAKAMLKIANSGNKGIQIFESNKLLELGV